MSIITGLQLKNQNYSHGTDTLTIVIPFETPPVNPWDATEIWKNIRFY